MKKETKNFIRGLFLGGVFAWLAKSLFDSSKMKEGAKKKAPKLSRKEKTILEYLNKNGKITNDEVENLLGVSDATAERYLDRLEKKDFIRQIGESGRGVYYRPIKNGS